MLRAFIGLGSNLANESGDSRQILRDAIAAMSRFAIGEVKVSSLYASSPMGPQDQPDYVNAAALLFTNLQPHQLLDQLQKLELNSGRVRLRRWGERTLDLDILIMDHALHHDDQDKTSLPKPVSHSDMIKIRDERLILPHIGILDRSFVVQPLLELDAHLAINDIPLADCAAASSTDGIRIIAELGWEQLS